MSARGAVVLLLWLLLSGCTTSYFTDAFRPDEYVVRPGDTLYSIAWRYGLDHEALMRWNNIDDPRRLQIGERLVLQPPGESGGRKSAASGSGGGRSQTGSANTGGQSDSPGARGGSTQAAGPQRWHWPTEGSVIRGFDDGSVSGRGIDIAGDAGQWVHASAAGEVVYSGSGLEAYGRLVIIRHRGDYLSAYAYNRELVVEEGDRVDAGQRIARMGQGRDGRTVLHFEIRRGGTPVDPQRHLPRR